MRQVTMTISLNPLRDAQTDVISQGQEAAVVADGGDVRSHLAGGIDRGTTSAPLMIFLMS
jgi:hypothetical protein